MFADEEDSTRVEAPTVYPGNPVTAEIESRMSCSARRNEAEPQRIKLGPGLLQTSPSTIVPVRVGRLCDQRGRRFWLHSRHNYYQAAVNDLVLGTVITRTAEFYRVDIGTVQPAMLSVLAFEGATRKNRPVLQVGALVYARISAADRDLEPELACTNAEGKREEVFGEIKEGAVLRIPCSYAQQLQLCGHPLLPMIGKHFAFESIVGVNGLVAVRTDDAALAMGIMHVLRNAEQSTVEEMQRLVSDLVLRNPGASGDGGK